MNKHIPIPKDAIDFCIKQCTLCIQSCEDFEACMVKEGKCEALAKTCVTQCLECSHACKELVRELEAFIRNNVDNMDIINFKEILDKITGECGFCIFICDACSASCETSLSECRVNCKKCIEACYACISSCKKCLQGCPIKD